MITFVLSFFSTFSSAEEKNSALSPSLMSPSTYRIVKLSRCFFSTITNSSGELGVYSIQLRKVRTATTAFIPPKPNELERKGRTSPRAPRCGT